MQIKSIILIHKQLYQRNFVSTHCTVSKGRPESLKGELPQSFLNPQNP